MGLLRSVARLFIPRFMRRRIRRELTDLVGSSFGNALTGRTDAIIRVFERRLSQVELQAFPEASEQRARAAALNRRLYEDNPDIDRDLLERIDRQIDEFSDALKYDDEYRAEWHRHRYRLAATIPKLRQMLKGGLVGLELGGYTLASMLLAEHFPSVEWRHTDWDVRGPWPCEDASLDVVVAMEVFEHLADLPSGLNDTMRFTGFKSCLAESFRALRPGGALFATTPNSTSVECLRRILDGNTGIFYYPHIREYSGQELADLVREAGFEIEEIRAVHCLTIVEEADYTPIFLLLLIGGLSVEDRGDDWFVTLRKPGSDVPTA